MISFAREKPDNEPKEEEEEGEEEEEEEEEVDDDDDRGASPETSRASIASSSPFFRSNLLIETSTQVSNGIPSISGALLSSPSFNKSCLASIIALRRCCLSVDVDDEDDDDDDDDDVLLLLLLVLMELIMLS